MKRVILIVLDSVGIGELPDAEKYFDVGSNTLINIKKAIPSMNLKNLNEMGLSNIDGGELLSDEKILNPTGAFGKCAEASQGKDTTVGHWEMSGIILEKPFPTYPNGFPQDVLDEFTKLTGRGVLGNIAASGTEIIKNLGEEHMKTGKVIVYTSADSVFQIAANEEIVPIEELYDMCGKSREMLQGEHAVSRVIARPFIGTNAENFTRTKNRHDFSLEPLGKTMLDYIKENGQSVAGVGKINDIFTGVGITEYVYTEDNMDSVDKTLDYMKKIENGLIFSNLVDFDMKFGHRNDSEGYANALIEFDNRIPEIIGNLRSDDILIITADHGCDPTTQSTDHSREYIPLLVYGKNVKSGVDLKIRNTFADIGATILDYLNVDGNISGESFLGLVSK